MKMMKRALALLLCIVMVVGLVPATVFAADGGGISAQANDEPIYVLAGGDFNQVFEDAQGMYPVRDESYWQPGMLKNSDLPAGFRCVYDASVPTCRLLNEPYSGDRSKTQLYVIDGFIVSDNLHVNLVETVDLNFAHTDHQPVFLQVTPE